jgi:hypothetical protein
MTVGSSPPCASTAAMSEVVEVFPCAPPTVMAYLRRSSSASISPRGMIGMPRRFASTISGLSFVTALEYTTTSAPATCAPS